jgi:hypothetical protein
MSQVARASSVRILSRSFLIEAKIIILVADAFGNISFVQAVFIKNHFGCVRQYLAVLVT